MTPSYLDQLDGNIGIALGEPSRGLCAIDIDEDPLVEVFLKSNPGLDTLQTHGNRGRVFWIRFKDDYPEKTSKLKDREGQPLGEFRSTGSQSIVSGIHPDSGKPYQLVDKRPAARIDFKSLHWPASISNPPALQSNRVSEVVCS